MKMWRAARIVRFILLLAIILLLLSPRKFFFVDMEVLFLVAILGALMAATLVWVLYKSLKTGRIQSKQDDISRAEKPGWYWFMISVNMVCLAMLIIAIVSPIHMLWAMGML